MMVLKIQRDEELSFSRRFAAQIRFVLQLQFAGTGFASTLKLASKGLRF
jgi:hypothetical protein